MAEKRWTGIEQFDCGCKVKREAITPCARHLAWWREHLPALAESGAANAEWDARALHWITEIRCDHERKMDKAFCACGWEGMWAINVGRAVGSWWEHHIDKLAAGRASSGAQRGHPGHSNVTVVKPESPKAITQAAPAGHALSERILCMECGKSVSTPVPNDTIVRAWIECPECIEKRQPAGKYRVVCKENPDISPFPSHVWPTRELAEAFCSSDEAGEWKGKLRPAGDGTEGK